MRKRLMASTAAMIIVGFLVAFALAAKLVQDQYQLEFTRRLDSILAMMESQVDDIGQDPQGFAVKIGKELQEKGQACFENRLYGKGDAGEKVLKVLQTA